MEEDIKILEEKIEKDYKDMMAVINSTSLPLFVEDTIEDMHILIKNLIARNKETKQELESVKEIYYTQKEIETNYIPVAKAKKVIFDIEQALSFARTGRNRRAKIQCEILENVRNKLEKELLD